MLTRTIGQTQLKNNHISVVSVDTGLVTNEFPHGHANHRSEASVPLDERDGAARILDPVFLGYEKQSIFAGVFFKDYQLQQHW